MIYILQKHTRLIRKTKKNQGLSDLLNNQFVCGVAKIVVYTSLSQFLVKEDVWATEAPQPACHAGLPKWNSEARLRLMAGRQQGLGQIGLFSPLFQNDTSLLFADIRYFRSSKDNSEGNFGLAHRQIIPSLDWIFGGYGFFDNRWTEHHNRFQQTTLGVEALSEHYDLRTNFYIPLSKSKTIRPKTQKPIFRGHSEYFNKSKEFALRGLDYEIGRSVPGLDCLRLYVAGYHFQAKDVKSIDGVRTRFRLEVNKYINIDGEYQYDNVRHSAPYIGFTIRIPFGETTEKHLTPLEKRMQTDIVRDIDVVTRQREVPQPSGRNFIFTKPGAKGDGTYENPAGYDETDPQSAVELNTCLANHPGFFHYDLGTGVIKSAAHKCEELKPTLELQNEKNQQKMQAEKEALPDKKEESDRNQEPVKALVNEEEKQRREEVRVAEEGRKEDGIKAANEAAQFILKRQKEEPAKLEQEQKRRIEEERLKTEHIAAEERQRKDAEVAEKERQRKEAEVAEVEKRRKETEAAAEAERKRKEEAEKQRLVEDQKRKDAEVAETERKRRVEEEKKRRDEEARLKAEETEKQRLAEEKKHRDEEAEKRKREEEVAAKKKAE